MRLCEELVEELLQRACRRRIRTPEGGEVHSHPSEAEVNSNKATADVGPPTEISEHRQPGLKDFCLIRRDHDAAAKPNSWAAFGPGTGTRAARSISCRAHLW